MTEPEEFTWPAGINRDTCDHCGPGVLAYVWAIKGDQELTYCGSCGKTFREKLLEWADVVHDLTYIAMQR